jgi:hypothetical protein
VDIAFLPSSEVPLPPDEIRFRSVRIEPYPDGRRVRVSLEVTPFQMRPNVDIEFLDHTGDVAASAHIIEASEPKMMLTLHFRRKADEGAYTARLTLGYADQEPADVTEMGFELGPGSNGVRD